MGEGDVWYFKRFILVSSERITEHIQLHVHIFTIIISGII